MTDRKQSYEDFQNQIFEELKERKIKWVAHEMIKMATDIGMTQDQLIQFIRTTDHENRGEILDALLAFRDKDRIATP
jgi:hypothetical protein